MIKIHIVSGFLGAGKTTLIRYLLQERQGRGRLAVIENEFGQIGLDSALFTDGQLEVREINSGCICCSLVGDFRKALQKLIQEYEVEEIIIEPSGVGLLSDVKETCLTTINAMHRKDKKGFWQQYFSKNTENEKSTEIRVELGSVITVVDAKKYRYYLANFGDFFQDQLVHADKILLSRLEFLTDEQRQACIKSLRKLNPRAYIFTRRLQEFKPSDWYELLIDNKVSAPDMISEAERLLNSELAKLSVKAAFNSKPRKFLRKAAVSSTHGTTEAVASDVFSVAAYKINGMAGVSAEALRTALQADVFGCVLRCKGIMHNLDAHAENSQTVGNGAQTVNNVVPNFNNGPHLNDGANVSEPKSERFIHIEFAGGQWAREYWPQAEHSQIVFIGVKLDFKAIETFFKVHNINFEPLIKNQ